MIKIFITLLLLFNINTFADDTKKFSQEQLDQMMAPIALYPDALLSQILMATTFNTQLKEAIDYAKANPKEKGDEAVKKVQDKDWDASVASLVAFPQVLDMLGKKPSWAKELGDAFLAEPDKVMDTVQSLRKKAVDAGNLKTTQEQKVETDDEEAIVVAPATQTVYVPVYDPHYAYGPWWYSYPPYYYYPPHYRPVSGVVIGFGVGIGVSYALWGGFGWHNHSTYINVNHYNNININKISGNGNKVDWKDHNQRNKKDNLKNKRDKKPKNSKNPKNTKDAQRDNAKKAMEKKGLNVDKERKQLSGSKGDNLRKDIKQDKFKSTSKSNALSGIDKPKHSQREASRGSFSRGNKGSSHGGGFSRGGRSRGRR